MNRAYAEADGGRQQLCRPAALLRTGRPHAAQRPGGGRSLAGDPRRRRSFTGWTIRASQGFGRNCLLARRLLERGVRFVQLFNGGAFGSPRINWDGHETSRRITRCKPRPWTSRCAGLIQDLKQRGMLDDTLLIWNTEFGRSPATQGIGSTGRDHHPDAFTCFLAGAGVKKGFSYGATDEVGYFASDNPVTIYDFHATILHLLGIDHERSDVLSQRH